MKFNLLFLFHFVLLVIVLVMSPHSSAQGISKTSDRSKHQSVKSDPQVRMTPELLWKLGRLGEAAVTADGTKIAYTVKRFDIVENKGFVTLFLLDRSSGTEIEWLSDWQAINSLQWVVTESGERLFFDGTPPAAATPKNDDAKSENSKTDDATTLGAELAKAPTNQAYSISSDEHATRQITSVTDGIANLKVSPTGNKIAFTVDVKMEQKPNEIYPDLPKADARMIDGLMYRHWNAWSDYSFSHLHVSNLDQQGRSDKPIDLLEGVAADCPVPPFGGREQFDWSPDGTELAFTMKNVPDWARSTNSDVYLIAADGKAAARNITSANEGYDNNPLYSPDGNWIVYHSMQRPGFEADRNRLMLYDRVNETVTELTAGFDQSAGNLLWLPDSSGLVFSSETRGTNQLFRLTLKSKTITQISGGRYNWDPVAVLADMKTLIVSQVNMLRPEELAQIELDVDENSGTAHNKKIGKTKTLTHINDDIYQSLELPIIEERFVTATDGEKIQCWVIQPPDFDPAADKKWPMLTYCQGGPQSQIGQWFSYRWNFHLMAAQGYVVVAPNRRGLPGFGQKWNDEISGDWGGQAMQDLLSVTDNMLEEPYIDRQRTAAVGASFGGYSVYWLMGHHKQRFAAMVAHCGVFNLESMYGSTEELFFVDHDLGGPYWKSDDINEKYQTFSPHRFVRNWETPLLVIHGEKDFRVPVTQGMEAFTAAQIQNVPSRFLYFPDEGHWVQSPQNSILWQRVFFDWLDRYCKPGS